MNLKSLIDARVSSLALNLSAISVIVHLKMIQIVGESDSDTQH